MNHVGTQLNTKSDNILFLCPNGHRLNAPRRMQGQPGKCPHCSVRFRVPNLPGEAIGNDEEIATASATGVSSLSSSGDFDAASLSDSTDLASREESGTSDVLHSSIGRKAVPATPPDASRPRIFQEFSQLWKNRTAEVSLEIHLPEGEVFVPQNYSSEKSSAEMGYFARKNESGRFQVHLIPWSRVNRIVVSGLSDLPFEA